MEEHAVEGGQPGESARPHPLGVHRATAAGHQVGVTTEDGLFDRGAAGKAAGRMG
jgi:hypothetical protein